VSYPELDRVVQNFIAEISKTGIVLSPQSDLRLNTPELKVAVNRDKLGDVGVSVETVGRTLQTMLGGRQVTRFKKDGEQYDVMSRWRHATAAGRTTSVTSTCGGATAPWCNSPTWSTS